MPGSEYEVVWALIKEVDGWRICEMAVDTHTEGEEVQVVNFENLSEVVGEPTGERTASLPAANQGPANAPALPPAAPGVPGALPSLPTGTGPASPSLPALPPPTGASLPNIPTGVSPSGLPPLGPPGN